MPEDFDTAYKRGLSRLVREIHHLDFDPQIVSESWDDGDRGGCDTCTYGSESSFDIDYMFGPVRRTCSVNLGQYGFAKIVKDIWRLADG